MAILFILLFIFSLSLFFSVSFIYTYPLHLLLCSLSLTCSISSFVQISPFFLTQHLPLSSSPFSYLPIVSLTKYYQSPIPFLLTPYLLYLFLIFLSIFLISVYSLSQPLHISHTLPFSLSISHLLNNKSPAVLDGFAPVNCGCCPPGVLINLPTEEHNSSLHLRKHLRNLQRG